MRGAAAALAGSIALAVAAGAPVHVATAPTDRAAWLERVERGRQDYRTFVEKASLSRAALPRMGEPARNDAASPDPTLRDGDILVEGDRLVIFRSRRIGVPFAGELLPFDPDAAPNHAMELKDIARALRTR